MSQYYCITVLCKFLYKNHYQIVSLKNNYKLNKKIKTGCFIIFI